MIHIVFNQPSDIVLARSAARTLAEKLGFGKADQTRLATAVSELTRNVIQYAGQGECSINETSDALFNRIEIIVQDSGPGIPDIELALQDGFSTGGGLGVGLSGTQRLVDSFSIQSEPGHTKITISLSVRKS